MIRQAPHALIVCKCDDNFFFIEKALKHWISIEGLSCSHHEPSVWGREEKKLFPVTLKLKLSNTRE